VIIRRVKFRGRARRVYSHSASDRYGYIASFDWPSQKWKLHYVVVADPRAINRQQLEDL
jgi:hypothetical protein